MATSIDEGLDNSRLRHWLPLLGKSLLIALVLMHAADILHDDLTPAASCVLTSWIGGPLEIRLMLWSLEQDAASWHWNGSTWHLHLLLK